MKLVHNLCLGAVVLVAISRHTANGASPIETVRTQIHQALSEWNPSSNRRRHDRNLVVETAASFQHHDQRRELNFAQCLSDTREMFDNSPALQLADDKVKDEVDTLEDENCEDGDTLCIVDEGTVDSVPLLKQACKANRGTIYEFDRKLECRLTTIATGESETIRFHYLNSPECLDPDTCTAADVAAAFEQSADEAMANLEARFAVEGLLNVDCDSDVTLSSTSSSDAGMLTGNAMVSLFGGALMVVAGMLV